MEKISLKSKVRTESEGNAKKLRKAGFVPAVVYGHKVKAQNLLIKYLDFEKVFRMAGENTLVELEIEGNGKANVLVHEVQNDPLTGKIAHVDLFQIKMDEKIETEIPLEFVGESPAVKALGGILVKNMDAVEVSCFPADLPHNIPVDISAIENFDVHIKVKDLKVSEKVKVLSDPENVVALVTPPRSAEELAQLDEKVEEDVTKVQGVVKEVPAEAEEKKE